MKINQLPDCWPGVVGIDIETTGLDFTTDRLLSIAVYDGSDVYVLTEDFGRIVPLLENPNVVKVAHNAIFDISFIVFRYPCQPQKIWCTLVMERGIYAGYAISFELDEILARRLHVLLDKTVRSTFIKHEGPLTTEQLEYIGNDVRYLIDLYSAQVHDINEKALGKALALDFNAFPAILDMTLTGVGFNVEGWETVRGQILDVVENLRQKMVDLVGEETTVEVPAVKKGVPYTKQIPASELNFGSPKQLLPLLHLRGWKSQNTDREAVGRYVGRDPLAELLLEYKEWSKASTWSWQDDISPITGRIHPSWNQNGALTGRFSCSGPNLQQAPRPKSERPNLRSLFLPLPGHKILAADWSQQEPRILAHISQDPRMVKAANESDIYIAFAQEIWKETVEKKDPRRQLTKTGVLATMYGSQADGLSPKMGVAVKAVEEFQTAVRDIFKTAYCWGNKQKNVAQQYGYVTTATGRRINFPGTAGSAGWMVANESRNAPIQGTGADMFKLAMRKIYDAIQDRGYDAHFMIAMHDEIVLSVNENQVEEFFPLVISKMEEAGQEICPSVKFLAEGKYGDVWAH